MNIAPEKNMIRYIILWLHFNILSQCE